MHAPCSLQLTVCVCVCVFKEIAAVKDSLCQFGGPLYELVQICIEIFADIVQCCITRKICNKILAWRNICRRRSVNFPTHSVHYTNWTNTGSCVSLFPSAANPSLLFPSEAEASLLPSGLTLSRRYDHYHTDAFWWFNEFKCITYDHIFTSSCQMFNRDEPEREKRVYVTVKASDMGRSVSLTSTMSPLEWKKLSVLS